jgi:S-adenosyl methyltransferase
VLHRPAWAPDEVDIERPAAARMYDYYLGGSHNFAADRALAEETIRVWPEVVHVARANRAFLHRAVAYLVHAGIDQFLDLGSGIPTGGNVHDIAHTLNPEARTVYVDADPVAIAHSNALLADVPYAGAIHADLRDPESILRDPVLVNLLDLTRPVAVLLVAALPFVPESDDPAGIVAAYRDATVEGSYLVITHVTNDYQPAFADKTVEVYSNASHSATFRSRAQLLNLMSGYELVPPGLVDAINWRPEPQIGADPLDNDPTRYNLLAGVGQRGS